MLIAQGNLHSDHLAGQTAIVSGGGSGIGFEAARSLAWLGADVILAEINRSAGRAATAAICRQMGRDCAVFIHTDVGSQRSVRLLARRALRRNGRIDIILNNATVAPLGAATAVPVNRWDESYRVNLRGPLLLAQAFLPAMLARRQGVFITVSSYGLAYMGAYEIFKRAQAELCSTLEAEHEDSGVSFFTIGPGVAPTKTYMASLPKLAAMYGKSPQEFSAMVENQLISVEAAGAGFAAAIALAPQFHGQETGSLPALAAAGIEVNRAEITAGGQKPSAVPPQALPYIKAVQSTLEKQIADWKQRSLFEQQWCIRDFKKSSGLPAERWLQMLQAYAQSTAAADISSLPLSEAPLQKLEDYYQHLYDLAQGYIKDEAQREEHLKIVQGWRDEVAQLRRCLAQAEPGDRAD